MSIMYRVFKMLFFVLCTTIVSCDAAPVIILLYPAGDEQRALRAIDGTYERSLTLKCAEALKKSLEMMHTNVRVMLTRLPGEYLEPLQNAHIANRMDADCFIAIHFYQETAAKPRLYMYYYTQNPLLDGWKKSTQNLTFIPFDQAHYEHHETTKKWGSTLLRLLEQEVYNHLFDFCGIFGVPHKALVGICAPAFCIEAGLRHKDEWQAYVAPLAHAISEIIRQRSA